MIPEDQLNKDPKYDYLRIKKLVRRFDLRNIYIYIFYILYIYKYRQIDRQIDIDIDIYRYHFCKLKQFLLKMLLLVNDFK